MSEKEAGQYNRMWGPPEKDPIEQEAEAKTLEPAPADKQYYVQQTYQKRINLAKTTEERLAWTFLQAQALDKATGQAESAAVIRDFHLWLQGKSPNNRMRLNNNKKMPLLTPWEDKSLLHIPEVREYLERFVTKRSEYEAKLHILRMNPPTTLGEAWLYYKYLVRGHLAHREFDLANGMLEFLDDFNRYTYGVIRDDKTGPAGIADSVWVDDAKAYGEALSVEGLHGMASGGAAPQADQNIRRIRYNAIESWVLEKQANSKGGRVALANATAESVHTPGALFWLKDEQLTARVDASIGPDVRSGVESNFMDDVSKAAAGEIIARRLAAEDELAKLTEQRVLVQKAALEKETEQAASLAKLHALQKAVYANMPAPPEPRDPMDEEEEAEEVEAMEEEEEAEPVPMDVQQEIKKLDIQVQVETEKLEQIRAESEAVKRSIEEQSKHLQDLIIGTTGDLQNVLVESLNQVVAAIQEQTANATDLAEKQRLAGQATLAASVKADANYELEIEKIRAEANASSRAIAEELAKLKEEVAKTEVVKQEIVVKQEQNEQSGEMGELQDDLFQAQQENEDLKKKLQELIAEKEALAASASASVVCATIQETINVLDNQIMKVKEENTEKQKEFRDLLTSTVKTQSDWAQKIAQMEADNQKLASQLGAMKAQGSQLAADLTAEQAKYAETASQLAALKEKKNEARKKALEEGKEELEAVQAEIEKVKREMERAAIEKAEKEDARRKLKEEGDELKKEMEAGKAAKEEAKARLKAARARAEKIRLDAEEQEAENEARENELADKKARAKAEYDEKLKKLNEKEKKRQKELEALGKERNRAARAKKNGEDQATAGAVARNPTTRKGMKKAFSNFANGNAATFMGVGVKHIEPAQPEVTEVVDEPEEEAEESENPDRRIVAREEEEEDWTNELVDMEIGDDSKAFNLILAETVSSFVAGGEYDPTTFRIDNRETMRFMVRMYQGLRAGRVPDGEAMSMYKDMLHHASNILQMATDAVANGWVFSDSLAHTTPYAVQMLGNLGFRIPPHLAKALLENNAYGAGGEFTPEGIIAARNAIASATDDPATWMRYRVGLMAKGASGSFITNHDIDAMMYIINHRGLGQISPEEILERTRQIQDPTQEDKDFLRMMETWQAQTWDAMERIDNAFAEYKNGGFLPGDLQFNDLMLLYSYFLPGQKLQYGQKMLELANGRDPSLLFAQAGTHAVGFLDALAEESAYPEDQRFMNKFAQYDGAMVRYYNVMTEQWEFAVGDDQNDFELVEGTESKQYAPYIGATDAIARAEERGPVTERARNVLAILQNPNMTRDITREMLESAEMGVQSAIAQLIKDLQTAFASSVGAGLDAAMSDVMKLVAEQEAVVPPVPPPDNDFFNNTAVGNILQDALTADHPNDKACILDVLMELNGKIQDRMSRGLGAPARRIPIMMA